MVKALKTNGNAIDFDLIDDAERNAERERKIDWVQLGLRYKGKPEYRSRVTVRTRESIRRDWW